MEINSELFPTVEHDEMRVLLTPLYGIDETQVGEDGLVWSDNPEMPWSSDVSVAFEGDGFRATINTPYHETRYDADDEPLFAPGQHPMRIRLESPAGITAQERHIILSGVVRAIFVSANFALREYDARQHEPTGNE